jgi:predicted alpha/beta superfamily hydrolase
MALTSLPVPISYSQWRGTSSDSPSGEIMVFPEVRSAELNNARTVAVYLPPGYRGTRKRFPSIYMHDGQNLFDSGTSFAGVKWAVDETMQTLAAEGYQAIVVAVWNSANRQHEFTPFSTWWPGTGDAYLSFVTKTVKPLVDGTFRTIRNRENTGIIGSSLGALITTYAYFKTRVFGFMGALSPAYWPGNGEIYRIVKQAKTPTPKGRIYLDNGSEENSAQRMYNFLTTLKGYEPGPDIRYVEEQDAQHNEAAWARRLPNALRFLLGPLREPTP